MPHDGWVQSLVTGAYRWGAPPLPERGLPDTLLGLNAYRIAGSVIDEDPEETDQNLSKQTAVSLHPISPCSSLPRSRSAPGALGTEAVGAANQDLTSSRTGFDRCYGGFSMDLGYEAYLQGQREASRQGGRA
jgi:hypothetical protein